MNKSAILEVPASVETAVVFCSPQLDALEALWEMLEADEYT